MSKIDFRQLKKGMECILLPDYFPETMPQKVYFMFVTEEYGKANKGYFEFAKLIFAKDIAVTAEYENLEDFRSKQKKFGIDKENIEFIADISHVKIFSDAQFNQYNKLYSFIFERKETFNKALKFFYPLGEIKDIAYSEYFNKIKKTPYFGHLRFRITIAWMYAFGIFRYIIKYPFVFIVDLFKLTFDKYINYKKRFIDLDSKETKNTDFLAHCMGTPENEIEEAKKSREDAFETAKKEYINSNIAFLTLLLSIILFIVAQVLGFLNNKEIKLLRNENATISTSYENAQKENQIVNNTLLEKELEIKILQARNDNNEQIIDLYRRMGVILDDFDKRIKAIEKSE
jgi:hypothetical protein